MTTSPRILPLLDFGPRPIRVFFAGLAATAAFAAAVAPAHALPEGCAANPECLVEHVFGGSGAAPVQPAAAAPVVAIASPQPLVAGAGRGARVTIRVRTAAVSVLEVRVEGRRVLRRLVGAGAQEVRVPLGRRVRPGRRRVELIATDGAGRRGTAVADVVVVGAPARVERGQSPG